LKDYFHDVLQVDISTGFLTNQVQKVSAALKSPYEELGDLLKEQSHLHIDKTSFKKNGKLQWAWCFVSEFFTYFKIEQSRGNKVFHATLGEDFLGGVCSDFFSVYLKDQKETGRLFQFCRAPLIREIKFGDTGCRDDLRQAFTKVCEVDVPYYSSSIGIDGSRIQAVDAST
jgi:hypothetical protein